MRIAYVCCDPGVPVFGTKGCSVHVQEVLRELTRRGDRVDLFAMRVGGHAPTELREVNVRELDSARSNARDPSALDSREQRLVSCNDAVRTLLAKHGPYDLVYERYSLFAYAAMEFARSLMIPGVLEVNAPLVEEQVRYRALQNVELAAQLTRRAMIAAGAVVAVSDQVADFARRQRLDQEHVYVVPNGVDVNRFAPRDFCHGVRPSGAFTIGFVGTLKPWHGVETLIDALGVMIEREEPARLLIVGDGPERKKLQRQAAALGAAGHTLAEFAGPVPPTEIPGLLDRMDVATAPYPASDLFYFSPLKIIEYMAAGLPTVASRVGQISETIAHGKTGVLYPAGDVQALVASLIQLKKSPELRMRLGRAARESVEARMTWTAVVDRILEIAAGVKPTPRLASPRPHVRFSRNSNRQPSGTRHR